MATIKINLDDSTSASSISPKHFEYKYSREYIINWINKQDKTYYDNTCIYILNKRQMIYLKNMIYSVIFTEDTYDDENDFIVNRDFIYSWVNFPLNINYYAIKKIEMTKNIFINLHLLEFLRNEIIKNINNDKNNSCRLSRYNNIKILSILVKFKLSIYNQTLL
jgi:hypothetical protein